MVKTRKKSEEKQLFAGRYEIKSLVGSGVTSEVYLAYDAKLKRDVAIKRLRDVGENQAGFEKLFESEANLTSSLNHPNIITIYDWGTDDGCYLVTEFLGHGSLRNILNDETKLSDSQIVDIVLQIAKGLRAAHRKELIHRDIKPENILFDEQNVPKIADFGIARSIEKSSFTEKTGAFYGTVKYSAPEQHKVATGSTQMDPRCDVYGLGIVLAELITEEIPLQGEDPYETLKIRKTTPIEDNENVYRVFNPVLIQMCRPDVDERITMDELVASLEEIKTNLVPAEPLKLEKTATREIGQSKLAFINSQKPSVRHAEKKPFLNIYTLTVSIIFLIVLVGGFFFYSLKNSGNTIPNFEELTLKEAELSAEKNSWVLEIKETRKDGTRKDEILSQNPDPGAKLKEGGTVNLVVSKGSEFLEIPKIIGLPEKEATDLIKQTPDIIVKPLEFDTIEGKPMSQVIGISVDDTKYFSNEAIQKLELEKNAGVSLIINTGVMPSVITLKPATAKKELEAMGLKVEIIEAFDENIEKGLVADQVPLHGQVVKLDEEVYLFKSKGRESWKIKNYIGQSASEAYLDLIEQGQKKDLYPLENYSNYSVIKEQDPAPGTPIYSDTYVKFTYGLE